jgi:methyl-accepting chemotaxis protein
MKNLDVGKRIMFGFTVAAVLCSLGCYAALQGSAAVAAGACAAALLAILALGAYLSRGAAGEMASLALEAFEARQEVDRLAERND